MSVRRSGGPRAVVIGAGAAGLAAARALRRAKVEALVVEARDRIGGRVDTRVDPLLGVSLEHGAEFVHGRPPRTLALAREARRRIRPIPERRLAPGNPGLADAAGAFARAHALLVLGERDDESLAALLARVRARRRFGPDAVALARNYVEGFYLADPRTASSLAIARMERALDDLGADRTYRPEGGYAGVLAPLARGLEPAAGTLRLSTVVEEVRWGTGHVELRIRGATGAPLPTIRADRAIVTLPLGVLRAGAVRFRPALRDKERAAGALEMGPVIKVLLRFRRAFWEERHPGLTFLHAAGAAVPVFWTLAPERAPVLVGWIGGPNAARLSGRSSVEVARAALDALSGALRTGAGVLEELLDRFEVADWTRDPFALGGYAVLPVGGIDAPRTLARPESGTLFFAGEATATTDDGGTVEAALETGERAAREVVASLG